MISVQFISESPQLICRGHARLSPGSCAATAGQIFFLSPRYTGPFSTICVAVLISAMLSRNKIRSVLSPQIQFNVYHKSRIMCTRL